MEEGEEGIRLLKAELITERKARREAEARRDEAVTALKNRGVDYVEPSQDIISLKATIQRMCEAQERAKKEREEECERHREEMEDLQKDCDRSLESYRQESAEKAQLQCQLDAEAKRHGDEMAKMREDTEKLSEQIDELNRKLTEITMKLGSKCTLLQKVSIECSSYKSRAELAEETLEKKNDVSPEARNENIELQKEIGELKRRIEGLEKDALDQGSELDKSKKELERQSGLYKKLVNECRIYKDRAEKAEETLEKKDEMSPEERAENLELHKEIGELKRRIEGLEKDGQEQDTRASTMEAQLRQEVSRLEEKAKESKEKRSEELGRTKSQIEDRQGEIAALKVELQKANDDVKMTRDKLEKMAEEKAEMEKQAADEAKKHAEMIDEIQSQVEAHQGEIASLKVELQKANDDVEMARDNLEKMAEEKAEMENQAADVAKMHAEFDISDKKKEYDLLMAACKRSEEHEKQLRSSHAAELERLKAEIGELKRTIEGLEKDAQEQVTRASSMEMGLRQEVSRMEEQAKESKEKRREELELANSQIETHEGKIAALKAELEKANDDVRMISEKMEKMAEEKTKMEKQAADVAKMHAEIISDKEKEYDGLLMAACKRSEDQEKRFRSSHAAELEGLKAEIGELKRTIEGLEKDAQEQGTRASKMEAELRQEVNRLEEQAKESNEKWSEELGLAKSQIEEREGEIAALKVELQKANDDVKMARQSLEKMAEEKAKLAEEKMEMEKQAAIEDKMHTKVIDAMLRNTEELKESLEQGTRVSRMEAELRQEVSRLEEQAKDSKEKWSEELGLAKSQIEAREGEIAGLKADLQKANDDATMAREKMAEEKATMEKQAADEAKKHAEIVSDKKKEYDLLMDACKRSEEQEKQLRSSFAAELEGLKADLIEKEKELITQKEAHQTKLQHLTTSLEYSDREVRELRAVHEMLARRPLPEDLERLKKRMCEKEEELISLKTAHETELQQLTTSVAKTEKSMLLLKEMHEIDQQRLRSSTVDLNVLNAKNTDLMAEISQLKSSLLQRDKLESHLRRWQSVGWSDGSLPSRDSTAVAFAPFDPLTPPPQSTPTRPGMSLARGQGGPPPFQQGFRPPQITLRWPESRYGAPPSAHSPLVHPHPEPNSGPGHAPPTGNNFQTPQKHPRF